MSYNQKQVLKDNITAITIVMENKTGKYTSAEIEALQKYRGFGGLKAVMWGDGPLEDWKDASKADRELYILFRELYQILDDNLTGREYTKVLDSMKNSILTAFYTPSVVPRVFYEVLQKYIGEFEWIYEPSAGAGVFITELAKYKPWMIQACEKDILTARVLQAICSKLDIATSVFCGGFEDSNTSDDGEYQLCVTNPPYGAFPVYDSKVDKLMCTKIHNYFVAKGLSKLTDGGVMALLISSAFLDTVTNSSARQWLFERADLISICVMPDNLMKDSSGTEAPSHFLVVRKNSSKTVLSAEEQLLCASENWNLPDEEKGTVVTVSQNKYIRLYGEDITIGDQKIGKNQYGKPSVETWWDKPIEEIGSEFSAILSKDFSKRYFSKPVLDNIHLEVYDTTHEQETEEESTAQLEDEIKEHLKDRDDIWEVKDDPADTAWIEPVEAPLAKYDLKNSKEREIMEKFIEIRNCYNELEQVT